MKTSVRQNQWGNWWGYRGSKKVYEIGASEFDAKYWLAEEQKKEVQRESNTDRQKNG